MPSYYSSLIIIEHMDPNLRLLLSQHSPALQSIEKSTPLYVQNLEIHPLHIQINETSYQIGIIRRYHDEEAKVPSEIACSNFLGGKGFDMDRYGFQVADLPIDKSPDETRIDGRNFSEHRLGWRQQWERQQCKEWEQELERLKKAEDLQILSSWFSFDNRIRTLQNQLLPFQLRESQTPPPYTHFIQLTIRAGSSLRKERIEYSGSIYDAMKHLVWKMFAGRSGHGYVKTRRLEMDFKGLVRLPKSLQIKAKEAILEEEERDILGDIVEV